MKETKAQEHEMGLSWDTRHLRTTAGRLVKAPFPWTTLQRSDLTHYLSLFSSKHPLQPTEQHPIFIPLCHVRVCVWSLCLNDTDTVRRNAFAYFNCLSLEYVPLTHSIQYLGLHSVSTQ